MTVTDIEQQRRDLNAKHPDLYQHISTVERAKLCDSLGDLLSNRGWYDAANFVWAHEQRATQ